MKRHIYNKPPLGTLVDWSEPINRDLVAWWVMNESVGSHLNDTSGNGNHGTLKSTTSWVGGRVGPALSFNGSSDFVLVTNDGRTRFALQEFTISAWIKVDSFVLDNTIWSYDFTSHVDPFYAQHVRFGIDAKAQLRWNHSGVNKTLSGSRVLSTKTWYHVVAVYRSGFQRLYIDGQIDAESSQTGTITYYNQEVWIARANFATGSFSGDLDNIQIWGRALIASEAQQLSLMPFKGLPHD